MGELGWTLRLKHHITLHVRQEDSIFVTPYIELLSGDDVRGYT